MIKKTLEQLYREHAGKVSDKWSIYLSEYERILSLFQNMTINLLEIGIQNGGSLEIWAKYFSDAQKLVGCDIDPNCANLCFDDHRIVVVVGDANSDTVTKQVLAYGPEFDVIIDDGSHRSSDIVKSFALYFPHLIDGGVFIVEDLHCSYWQEFQGGLYDPFSSITFFKCLADVVSHEHWGIQKARVDILHGFFSKYGFQVNEEALRYIHSVEFINSMCVIRKAKPEKNRLGKRFLVGSGDMVEPVDVLRSSVEGIPDQTNNKWSSRIQLPDEELLTRIENFAKKDRQFANLEQAMAERDAKIADLKKDMAERDLQIDTLNQDIIELEERIDILNQNVTELGKQVNNLNHTVTNREAQINNLNHAVSERDGVIRQILDSNSWRITRPLRVIKTLFKNNSDTLHSKITTPKSSTFLLYNIKKVQVIREVLAIEKRRCGGLSPVIRKAFSILKREGWTGLRNRAISIYTQAYNDTKPDQAYESYIEIMEPTQNDLEQMKALQVSFRYRPKFSIVVPVYNVEIRWLRLFIESVQSQVYSEWELCIADDCSTMPHIRPLLIEYAEADPRIKLIFRETNGHISAATNSAIELATGDFMCLMDHDDEIASNALCEFAHLLNQDDQIDMIYSDEDKIDLNGNRHDPFFKPDWSPESLEGCMYTAHFACYRMSIVRELGAFRTGYDGAQDYDFVLRFTERAKKIIHVPKVLYHWRTIPGSTAATMDAKDYVLDSAVRALQDRTIRMSGGGNVKLGRYAGSFETRYAIQGLPLVSVIIPSAGRLAKVRGESIDLLVNVVKSIYEKNTYPNFEVIIVDNNDLRQETVEMLSPYACKFVHFKGDFNIASKMNLGAKEAKGDYFIFMNDDIDIIAYDWMECMLQLAQRTGIGVVGAKLFFENDKIQHVGVAFWNGLPDHICREYPESDPGNFFSSCSNRNYLAVTGAVMMTKKSIFQVVGGFDERFAINYNDIDYCLKVFEKGLRVVFAAGAELYHYESVSRERTVAEIEIELFQKRWRALVSSDPYYSSYFESHPPNFSLRTDWSSLSHVDP